MGLLGKDAILAVQDLPYEDVAVPEWGGTVRVAGLNGQEASSFSAKLVKMDNNGKVEQMNIENFLPELLSRTLVDEHFERLFSEQDVAALGKKSAAVLKRLGDAAMRLSGLSEAAQDEAKKN